MTRLVSLGVVTVLIIFLGITFFHVVAPFLLPLFLAAVIAMLSQPIQAIFVEKTKGRTQIAAGLTTGSVLLAISIPIVFVVLMATYQVYLFVDRALERNTYTEVSATIRSKLDIDRVTDGLYPYASSMSENMTKEDLREQLVLLRKKVEQNVQTGIDLIIDNTLGVANTALGLVGSLTALTVQFLMFVIALYYFLADGPGLVATSETLIPMEVEYQRELRSRFYKAVRAVVMATFFAAIGQGIATSIMLCCYFGFGHFVILFILATFASMVPLFGTWLVWGPCVLWLAWNGVWVPAILIAVVGIGFVGTLDNLIRTYVLQSDAQLHPLLAFVTVLGGVQVMGLWGVFFAPIIAAILHALIVIFNTEVSALSKDRLGLKSPEASKDQTDEIADECSEHTEDNQSQQESSEKPEPTDSSNG